jgi:hypothetical protein
MRGLWIPNWNQVDIIFRTGRLTVLRELLMLSLSWADMILLRTV